MILLAKVGGWFVKNRLNILRVIVGVILFAVGRRSMMLGLDGFGPPKGSPLTDILSRLSTIEARINN